MVTRYDISSYFKTFETNSKILLDSKLPSSSFNSYKRTTFTTWKMTMDHISLDKEHGALTNRILNMIAYLGADKIPTNTLLNLEETLERVVELNNNDWGSEAASVVDHAIIAWNYAAKYVNLIKCFSSLSSYVIQQLIDLQRFSEANSFGTSALQLLRLHLTPDDKNLFGVEYHLSEVHFEQAKYDQCLDDFKHLLNRSKYIFGDLHKQVGI